MAMHVFERLESDANEAGIFVQNLRLFIGRENARDHQLLAFDRKAAEMLDQRRG
jgi:hypothetical protein